MDFSNISRAELTRLMKLIERKEALQAQIDAIDRELRNPGATPAPAPAEVTPRVRRARKAPAAPKDGVPSSRRGAVREAILGLLQAAGPGGISVKELAEKLGKPPGHIHTWFSINGRGIVNVRKLGGGLWAWVANDAPAN